MATAFVYDDGGRAATGRQVCHLDCVTRAVAILTGADYERVWNLVASINAGYGKARHADQMTNDGAVFDAIGGYTHIQLGGRPVKVAKLRQMPGTFAPYSDHHITVIKDGVNRDIVAWGRRTVRGVWIKASEAKAWVERFNEVVN